jgi:D-sedoheptulose 7-phosphate isomerase
MKTATDWVDPAPQKIEYELAQHVRVIRAIANDVMTRFDIERASTIIQGAFKHHHRLFLCGNGGSAADCQHLAAEFVVKYKSVRTPYPAISLTTDSSILTAAGNDFGFDSIFSRQIQAHGQPGDVLLAISTSGKSLNVLTAIEMAKSCGMKTIGFSGENGMAVEPDVLIKVPSTVTARIQEAHILIGHILCDALE